MAYYLESFVKTVQNEWEFENRNRNSMLEIRRPRGVFKIVISKLLPASKTEMSKFWRLVMEDATNRDEVIPIMKSYLEFNVEKFEPLFKSLVKDGEESSAKNIKTIVDRSNANLQFIQRMEGETMSKTTQQKPETNTTEDKTMQKTKKNTKKAATKQTAKMQTKKTGKKNVDMNPVKKSGSIADVRQKVTDAVLTMLDEGVVPWHKPWYSTSMNYITKSPYSLLNQILLDQSGYYLSFKQVKQKGGNIKKGSKAKFVTFYRRIAIKEEGENGEETIKKIPFLRYYNVFHENQIEGIEFPDRNKTVKKKMPAAKTVANKYLKREGIKLYDNSVRAYYAHNADSIHVPNIRDFDNAENYYATLFHEMVHSTMKESRLNREHGKNFGDDPYAKEELVAEIGAAILCNHVGIDPSKYLDNSASYIAGWSKRFKQDKNLIVAASRKAEKAVNYILTGKKDEKKEQEEKAA